MKNELMSEAGAEHPKEAGCIGLVSHLRKNTCQFKVLFKIFFLLIVEIGEGAKYHKIRKVKYYAVTKICSQKGMLNHRI